jgi:hypothetical protein
MKRVNILLYIGILSLSGCAVFGPAERNESSPETSAPAASGSAVTAAPPIWTVRSLRQLTARVEFSGGDTEDAVECDISFFNPIKDSETVTTALLVADGELYPLERLTVVFVNHETHELRARAVLPRNSLLAALKAETVYLVAVIDKVEYQFEPGRDFTAYKNRVLKKLEAENQ